MDNNNIKYLYVNEKKSLSEISRLTGKSTSHIYGLLLKEGVVLRSRQEASKGHDIPEDILRHLYLEENMSITDIAKYFGIKCHGVILSRLDRYNIPKRKRGELKTIYKFSKDMLYSLYVEQKTPMRKLAKIIGCKHMTDVQRLLKKHGIPIRTTSEACTKYTFDKDVLYDMYINKKMSGLEIANHFGMKRDGIVMKWIRKFNIPISTEAGYEKMMLKRYAYGNMPTSKQQVYIWQTTGGELNYPVGRYSLDIALVDKKIYIEYDGSGHEMMVALGALTKQQFDQRQMKRNYYCLFYTPLLFYFAGSIDLLLMTSISGRYNNPHLIRYKKRHL